MEINSREYDELKTSIAEIMSIMDHLERKVGTKSPVRVKTTYQSTKYVYYSVNFDMMYQNIMEELNKLGEKGWCLTAVYGDTFIFARLVEVTATHEEIKQDI